MTVEEKAKESLEKRKGEYWCIKTDNVYTPYTEGYKDGLAEGKNETFSEEVIKNLKENTSVINSVIMGKLSEKCDLLEKENAELKKICDFNCPVHKLATHNTCLTCPAVRNSPYHDLKNVTDEELQKIIKDVEAEVEM